MKKNNVVHFPHLHARLLEKGWEALKEKQYETALSFFLEASELKSDPELEMCIVVCLVEIGEWQEAKARCQQLLEKKKKRRATVANVCIHLASATTIRRNGKRYSRRAITPIFFASHS